MRLGLKRSAAALMFTVTALLVLTVVRVHASTYVVMIPLDSPIYTELETLDGLGYLDTYFSEIRPFSRIEAARLTLEAERNMKMGETYEPLAVKLTKTLEQQLSEEIGWLRSNTEDNQPNMIHPLQSVEAQYIYSAGSRRHWLFGPNGPINAQEGTPLLPNNDGLQTDPGSNEVVRASGWAGFGSFLTAYAEGAAAGPITHNIPGTSRGQLLGAEVVVSLGNNAISFGQEERWWGIGQWGSLSQDNNAKPFYALTWQNIHPRYLPWIFRYLGPGRRQIFLGQLDADRAFAQHPWIGGHVVVFKPLPWFEFGLTREIIFGGRNNDHYDFGGFLGRFSGIATGRPENGNTKSQGGIFLKFHIPKLRNLQIYQEMNGADNLTKEIPQIGHYMPFLAVSYQGGVYLPRLTEDGLTDWRIEWVVNCGGYSVERGDSLYFTYDNQLLGHPIGPNATQVDMQFGRWLGGIRYKADLDLFYTEQAPSVYEGGLNSYYQAKSAFYPFSSLGKEHSEGVALDILRLADATEIGSHRALLEGKTRIGLEYVQRLNYGAPNSMRALVSLSVGLTPLWKSFEWR
jgi:hypothetical protein